MMNDRESRAQPPRRERGAAAPLSTAEREAIGRNGGGGGEEFSSGDCSTRRPRSVIFGRMSAEAQRAVADALADTCDGEETETGSSRDHNYSGQQQQQPPCEPQLGVESAGASSCGNMQTDHLAESSPSPPPANAASALGGVRDWRAAIAHARERSSGAIHWSPPALGRWRISWRPTVAATTVRAPPPLPPRALLRVRVAPTPPPDVEVGAERRRGGGNGGSRSATAVAAAAASTPPARDRAQSPLLLQLPSQRLSSFTQHLQQPQPLHQPFRTTPRGYDSRYDALRLTQDAAAGDAWDDVDERELLRQLRDEAVRKCSLWLRSVPPA